jgi:hypothetical protein
MEKADVLYSIQRKLIDDLGSIIVEVKSQYNTLLNNTWVFDNLDGLVKKLEPKRVEGVNYTRLDIENNLKNLINDKLSGIQKHVPEIKTEDVNSLVSVAGELYELIYSRAEKEVSALESIASNYSSAEELVKEKFSKSKSFKSKEDHQKWLDNVSKDIGTILNYVEGLGSTLAKKSGFGWKIKLTAAKVYLKGVLGIELDLPKLAADVSVAKEAILKTYQNYEKKLIDSRYS